MGETPTHKILREGYYWLTLFKYSHAYARRCQEFQKSVGREKKLTFPLQPVSIECPFQQWGLYVIGYIKTNSSQMNKYILNTIDYFTKWTKAIPLKVVIENHVIYLLESYIVTIFDVPGSLVFDNTKYFSSLKLTKYILENNIKIKYSTNYYPQIKT
jgi:hypothetical protein